MRTKKIIINNKKAEQFREFYLMLQGYRFYDHKGEEIYKWELFLTGLEPIKIFRKYEFRSRTEQKQ